MSPWPPKMATGQKIVNKALDAFIACWGFSLPHFPGWQGHPSLLLDLQPLARPADTGPPAPGPPTLRRRKTGTGYGHTLSNPATEPSPSLLTSLEHNFNCKHCEISFKNQKDLKNHIRKTSKSVIYARKEHRTSFSEEPHLIITPHNLSGREEEKYTSCQEKQRDIDNYKMKT